VITLAVDDWLVERLLTFDGGSEDLEDNGDAGPVDYYVQVDSPEALKMEYQELMRQYLTGTAALRMAFSKAWTTGLNEGYLFGATIGGMEQIAPDH
jgi:hypothetical protein